MSGHRPGKRRGTAVALAGALLSATITVPSSAALASRTSAAAPPDSGPRPASSQLTLAGTPPGLRAAALRTLPRRRRGAAVPGFVAGLESVQLGGSVAVSGTTAVIGATGVDNGAGAAYTFTRSRAGWRLATVLTDPPNVPGDDFGFSVAISGPTMIIGADQANGGAGAPDKGNRRAGAAYVYVRSGSSWRLAATLRDPPARAGDLFGTSVALTGATALVGAPGFHSGHAYVYTGSSGRWTRQATLAGTGRTQADLFGLSVALTGTTAVVGAPDAGSSRGRAYVFARMADRWPLIATLADPRNHPGDNSGSSVAASSTTILVGAIGVRSGRGATFVYVRNGTTWRLQATLMRSKGAALDSFGWSVAIDGSQAVVGAYLADGTKGGVFVYGRSGTTWRWKAALTDPDTGEVLLGDGDQFGIAVAIAGSTLVIGSDGHNEQSGAAYVYVMSGTRWRAQAALVDPRGVPGRDDGASVAIWGATAVVGAWGVNHESGAAYIYERSAGQWRRQATLDNPGFQFDFYGAAVAVSGSTVVVGAWGAEGLRGAVYVYVRSGGRWRQQSEILAPLAAADGLFGSAVAISGNTILIGAEDAHDFDGSAYVYVRSGSRWNLQAKLTDPHGAFGADFGEAVALFGGTALISADCADNCAGAAYAYLRSGSRWHRQATLTDPDRQPNDGFGTSLALSGTTAVIGAPGVRNNVGAAYVYRRPGTRWRRVAVLSIPRRSDLSGGFGGAVAVTGTGPATVALISGLSVSGLAKERSQCGSAFEFSKPTGRWHERARVVDPKCSSYDEFGFALAASGATALIGAPGADDNTGAAYLLTLLPPQGP